MNFLEIPSSSMYEDERYALLLLLEESGTPKLQPYADSEGIPTTEPSISARVRS